MAPIRRVRAVLLAGAGAVLALLPALPAGAAPTSGGAVTVTDDRYQKVSAAVAGPLDGGAPEARFAALVEGFAFTGEDGQPAATASTDFFFGEIECLTGSSEVAVAVDTLLRTATLAGTSSGTCFDFTTSAVSTFTARFALRWTATGPLVTERTVTRTDGTVCSTTMRSRAVAATGTLTWSAPEFGIGGTAVPTAAVDLLDRRDRCVTRTA